MIDLLPEERIIVYIRKHWIVFVFEMGWILVAGIVPLILLFLTLGTLTPLTTFFFLAWIFILFLALSVRATTYYLDMLIVTNKRLLDIDQVSLFFRDITIVPLERIQDVKTEVIGFFATTLKFGVLHVQTAGESKEIAIEGIRNPDRVRDIIMRSYQRKEEA